MAGNAGSLPEPGCVIQPKRESAIPIAVSIPQIEPGVWQASAEIACSQPGVMWTGPERTSGSEARRDRVEFIGQQPAGPGAADGGSLDYTPLGGIPRLWLEASAARLMDL